MISLPQMVQGALFKVLGRWGSGRSVSSNVAVLFWDLRDIEGWETVGASPCALSLKNVGMRQESWKKNDYLNRASCGGSTALASGWGDAALAPSPTGVLASTGVSPAPSRRLTTPVICRRSMSLIRPPTGVSASDTRTGEEG